MSILRSILAVLAGIVAVVVLSMGADYVLEHSLMPQMNSPKGAPADALAVALGYRVLFGVVGGWLTAKLAPSAPMTHAMVLGALGLAAAAAGAALGWKFGQHWYPIALVLLALPQTWVGAKLAARGRTRR